MRLRVEVQCASEHPAVPDADSAERWAQAAADAGLPAPWAPEAGEGELSLRFVDAGEGAALNASYRGRQGPTNVLSFSFEARELTDPPLLGDVVVCAGVVEAEARSQGKTVEAHFAHMVVHGVLHLLGYRHDAEEEALVMEAVERRALARLGFADPYAEREDLSATREGGQS